ncbi:DUF6262 family protein [Gordonia westfalica]|uniref:DUF6262 family protein n=1 Tax=Gordonia westfalica TaxID=158898 RepID=A0ABU2GMM2_9ACTN|nr:DUF6262 family protein [Gordonia westfalica]MDS1112716.1 DUF6262 family protein [Gordonia westfalica]OCW84103.1 hypothetical protein A8M60_11925 [Nocardia farcinica]
MTPPSDKAVKALNAHARQRSADARRRVQRALRDMIASGATINVNTVAIRAKVARKTIYANPDLREKIQAHSRITAVPDSAPGTEDNSIVSALRAQLTAKDSELRELKNALQQRDNTIAILYGRLEQQDDGSLR